MKAFNFLSIVLSSAAIVTVAIQFPDEARLLQDQSHTTDELEFKFQSDLTESEIAVNLESILGETGCSSCSRIFPYAGFHEQKHIEAGLHLWHRCDCQSAATDEQAKGSGALQAIMSLRASVMSYRDDFGLDLISRVYDVELAVVADSDETAEPNNKNFRGSGHRNLLNSNDPLRSSQSHYDVVGLPDAWDIMTQNNAWQGSQNVVVHFCDSGWDTSHEDLGANTWVNTREICGNDIDDDNNGYVDDCNGYNHADRTGSNLVGNLDHGTFVSGLLSANTDNGIGVAGIAGGIFGNRGAAIMTSVTFGKSGQGGFPQALVYAADNGAKISSNSWGYTAPYVFPSSMRDAIDYAVNAGVVVVFAAGNYNTQDPYYPGAYEKVISAAAVRNDKQAASFTNYGSAVDIAAPGVASYSTSFANGVAYSYKSGTSFSCPHVAGVLALGLSLYPAASPTTLKNCLSSTAENIDGYQTDSKYVGQLGAGLLNAPAFLNCVISSMPQNVDPQQPNPDSIAPPDPVIFDGNSDESSRLSPAPTPAPAL